jgi:hypothetical protein
MTVNCQNVFVCLSGLIWFCDNLLILSYVDIIQTGVLCTVNYSILLAHFEVVWKNDVTLSFYVSRPYLRFVDTCCWFVPAVAGLNGNPLTQSIVVYGEFSEPCMTMMGMTVWKQYLAEPSNHSSLLLVSLLVLSTAIEKNLQITLKRVMNLMEVIEAIIG